MENFISVLTVCCSDQEKQQLHSAIREKIPYSLFRTVLKPELIDTKLAWGKLDFIVLHLGNGLDMEDYTRSVLNQCPKDTTIIILDHEIQDAGSSTDQTYNEFDHLSLFFTKGYSELIDLISKELEVSGKKLLPSN